MGDSKMWGSVTYYGWILVCGINAKNSFGAYNGAQEYRFLFLNGQIMRAGIFSSQGLLPTQQIIFNR